MQCSVLVLNADTFTSSRKSRNAKIERDGTLQPSSPAESCPRAAGHGCPGIGIVSPAAVEESGGQRDATGLTLAA